MLNIWDLAIDKTGGYIYSRLILAVVSFLVHWLVFWLVGRSVPCSHGDVGGAGFAVRTGHRHLYRRRAARVLIGLLDKPSTGLAILIAIVVYQQVENYLLQPKVTAHTMEIHVTVAFGSVIAGSLLLGAVGALLALPAAATLQAFMASYLERVDVVQELEDAEAAQNPDRDPMGQRIRQALRRKANS